MTEVLMTLGTVRFSVQEGAFQKLSRRLEIRVAKQERAEGQTSRQTLGSDDTVDIDGVVYAAFSGGLTRVQSFRDLALQGDPQMLTDGMGNVWGLYILEKVEETASYFLPNGAPMKQEFRLSLGAYGADS